MSGAVFGDSEMEIIVLIEIEDGLSICWSTVKMQKKSMKNIE
jgi:hypothetical protein